MAVEMTHSSEFELDLTNGHLHELTEISIPETLTNIDLTCNRLKNIESRILSLTGLRSLSFRQNLLSDPTEFNKLNSGPCLESLDLRDNQFQEIPSLTNFTKLNFLEVSYNQIRSMQPLSELPATELESLYLASNKLTSIDHLSLFSNLRILELGFNRIKHIENLGHLLELEELWLGRNRISEVENLSQLRNLRRISIQSNRLRSMKGLESCTTLEELYLSHNGITQLQGLDELTRLKVLDVSNNQVSRVECLENLSQLEDLWLNDNQVENWEELDGALEGPRQAISTIYFENNPIAKHPNYKTRIRAMLPNLIQLDADVLVT